MKSLCEVPTSSLEQFAKDLLRGGMKYEAIALVGLYSGMKSGDAEAYINNDFKKPIKLESIVLYDNNRYIVKGIMTDHAGMELLWLLSSLNSVHTVRRYLVTPV